MKWHLTKQFDQIIICYA